MDIKNQVAVVTGGNRGIGFEICRQLGKLGVTVVLTSRDENKGLKACEILDKEELPVRFFQLDVTHAASIAQLTAFLKKEYGRCDILVNNAGILLDQPVGESSAANILNAPLDNFRKTMETNVYGPILLCQAIVPIMKQNHHGRIVNFSSGLGQLSDMGSGYPSYRVSKTAINALTRNLDAELKGQNILVNSVSPGWVRTDMGGPDAPRKVEEGADTAVWLATLPDGGPSGKFFHDRREISW